MGYPLDNPFDSNPSTMQVEVTEKTLGSGN